MKEVNPQETSRAYAFEMWMNAPMPMVTFFKTLNVSRLVKISRKSGMKFNMLMCWCIGKAARSVKEFYLLPVNDKLMQYDTIAVNTIVANRKGEVSSCDVPFCDDLSLFNQHYLQLTKQVAESCVNHDLTESMVIGTSALAQYEIDGAVGMYSGIFNNPFLIWGKYKTSPDENDAHRFFPVPPHANGRGARFPLFRWGSERNQPNENIVENNFGK